MTVIAGEIPAMRGLKSSFDRQSRNVDEVLGSLSNELGNVFWKGRAADKFRAAWDSEYRPALRRLAAALDEAAREVNQRAQWLEDGDR